MRLVFIGTGEIGGPTLRKLFDSRHEVVGIVTQPDKPVGRHAELTPPPIKEIALGLPGHLQSSLPLLQPNRIKEATAIEQIRALAPDVIVVVAYGQLLPRLVLEIPRVACLNVHASLLPRWRGAAPIQAAISAGDSQTGITIMYMDEGLDTGDLLLQRAVDIAADEIGSTLHDKLAGIAPDALADALELLEHGKAPRLAQDSAAATYAPKLRREDGIIEWSDSATNIERKIRAFNPWPGTSATVRDRSLKILAAELETKNGRPGEILPSDQGDLIMAAGEGALRLTLVQPEGRRRMTGAEYLRGVRSTETDQI